jgi:flagellin
MAQADYTRIATNIAALDTLNSLRTINNKLGVAQLRLATGKRINQASDDPAGLTIAVKMNARNSSLKAALSNIGDSKNMMAVAESALHQISDILTEMKGKATQAASDTLGTSERDAIQNQLESLAMQISDIVDETEWNSAKLIDGTVSKVLQTGPGSSDTTTWSLSQAHDSVSLGVASGVATGSTIAAASTGSVDSSFGTSTYATGVEAVSSGAFDGLTEVSSGEYKFRIANKATAAGTGLASSLNTVSGVNTFSGVTGAADELSSGIYKLTIDGHSGTYIDYTITDSLGNVVATYDNLVAGTATQLLSTTGQSLGIEIDVAATIATGSELNFEYIAAGEAKMELYQISGGSEQLTAVDANGTDDTGVDSRRSYFYVDATSGTAADRSYNTGLGFKVYLNTFDNITVGDTSEIDFTAAGDLTVDVSTASLANAYMDDVDTAITTVSDSLNRIGSLVSRLDAKEAAGNVAQVNIEAAYNRIMNADMALEQVEASKYLILQQTAMAMLAQSNMAPQGILSLFR